MAPHFSFLAWTVPWTGTWQTILHGVTKSWTRLSDLVVILLCRTPGIWQQSHGTHLYSAHMLGDGNRWNK